MSEKKENALILIDDLLSHKKNPTFEDIQTQLARHMLNHSQKSVYRYLKELKAHNAPIYRDPVTRKYSYTIETYRLKNNRITPKDQIRIASQIKSLLEVIKDTPVYDQAYKLLSDMTTVYEDTEIDDYLSKAETKMDLDFDKVIFLGPPIANLDKEIWNSIYTAIHKRQIITFTYKSMSKKNEEKRIAAPFQLIFDDGNWNVRCYDYNVKDFRMFTVSEIKDFSLYDKRNNAFEIPENFDFRNITTGAFGCYATDNWIEYKFKLTGYAKRHASNRIFGKAQTITGVDDNSIILQFTSNQDVPILAWALKWGSECTVLGPEPFVKKWKDQIKLMSHL